MLSFGVTLENDLHYPLPAAGLLIPSELQLQSTGTKDPTDSSMPEHKIHQTPIVQSLDRGLMILQAVALSKQPVSLGDLTELLGINHSSTFRLANTLRRRGFSGLARGQQGIHSWLFDVAPLSPL